MAITPEDAGKFVDWLEDELRKDFQAVVNAIETHIDGSIRQSAAATGQDGEEGDRSVVNVSVAGVLRAARENQRADGWPDVAWDLIESALAKRYTDAGWERFVLDRADEMAFLWFPLKPLD